MVKLVKRLVCKLINWFQLVNKFSSRWWLKCDAKWSLESVRTIAGQNVPYTYEGQWFPSPVAAQPAHISSRATRSVSAKVDVSELMLRLRLLELCLPVVRRLTTGTSQSEWMAVVQYSSPYISIRSSIDSPIAEGHSPVRLVAQKTTKSSFLLSCPTHILVWYWSMATQLFILETGIGSPVGWWLDPSLLPSVKPKRLFRLVIHFLPEQAPHPLGISLIWSWYMHIGTWDIQVETQWRSENQPNSKNISSKLSHFMTKMAKVSSLSNLWVATQSDFHNRQSHKVL